MKSLIILLTISLIFVSCGKVTRNKLVGKWDVMTIDKAYSEDLNGWGNDFYDTIRYENGTEFFYQGNPIYSQWGNRNYSEYYYEFKKDGTYQIVYQLTYNYGSDKTITERKKTFGSWIIMGKNKALDIKAGTRIQLNPIGYEQSTQTDSSGIDLGTTYSTGSNSGEDYITFEVENLTKETLSLYEYYEYSGLNIWGQNVETKMSNQISLEK